MSVISLLLSMLEGQHLCTVFITARYSKNCMHCLLVRLTLLIVHPWIAIKLLSLKCSPDCGFLTKQALWKSKGTWLMQLRMWRNCRGAFTEISIVDSIFRITPRRSCYRNYSIFCIHYKKEYLLIKQHTVEWQQLVKSTRIINFNHEVNMYS